ncbi:MAG TPA: hypothetical protein VFO83_03730, partial [Aggregicoccus sp.]|nr:hypothetical protein [Aggregicoccus sp.]
LFGWPYLLDEPGPAPEPPSPSAALPAPATGPAPASRPPPARRLAPAPSEAQPPPPEPEEAPVPSDTPSGIAVFNPPGTKPIKRGLVVPEGFELPPGYVRHYQTLDDGRQLPAVLTFHPDAQPKDAAGNPVEVGPDRLVPPELAPPGMPLEVLEVPEALTEEHEG